MSRSSAKPTAGVAVRTIDLQLAVGARTLLAKTNVEFPAGQVSLIVGPSGAGKSMLLYALAGLLDETPGVSVSGKVLVGHRDVTDQTPRPDFGIVFQQFALFDDLTPRGNVQFAVDHARMSSAPRSTALHTTDTATALLEKLGVPRDVAVSRLSGGQQQRLAVARTLAYHPNVILYDEPTSGLDALSSLRVARLIRDTQQSFGITSIVVTHDYDVLPTVADAVFMFDTRTRSLIPVPKHRWGNLRDMLLENADGATDAAANEPPPPLPPRIPAKPAHDQTTSPAPTSPTGDAVDGHAGRIAPEPAAPDEHRHPSQQPQPQEHPQQQQLLTPAAVVADATPPGDAAEPGAAVADNRSHRSDPVSVVRERLRGWTEHLQAAAWHTGSIAVYLASLPWWLVFSWLRFLTNWRRLKWCLRYFLHYARVVSGGSAHVYLAIMGFLIGFVATYFTFEQFPYREYTRPLLIENLLQAVGFLLYRVLVPLLATVLIAARCGAAVASDLGAKSYGRQLHAMRSFGVHPPEYLLTGTLWAFLIGTPWLTFVAFCVARITSRLVFLTMFPERPVVFWDLYFHWELRSPDHFLYAGTSWLLAKLLVCALGTALIAYQLGTAPKESSGKVRSAITTTILWSTLWVLVTHFAFTFYEFRAYQEP